MYDGTLGTRGPWQALVAFQQLVILADKHGQVDMTAEAIARRTTIPVDIITVGIAALELPDPDSRSPDEDGRRIVKIDPDRSWGWRVVNYDHYRKIRSEEERREYHRRYMRERRAKANSDNGVTASEGVNTVLRMSTNSSKQYAGSKKQEDADASSATPAPHDLTFSDIAHQDAYHALRRACHHPPSFDAAIGGLLQGVSDRPFTPAQVGSGLMDMAAKGVQPSPSAVTRFAQFARNAEGAPEATPRHTVTASGNPFADHLKVLEAQEARRVTT